MPSLMPSIITAEKNKWEDLSEQLNFLFSDVYSLLGTVQGRDGATFEPESITLPSGSYGDVLGPAAHTADYVPQWNGVADSKTLVEGFTISANGKALVGAANYAAMRALLDLEAGTDFYSIAAANAAFQPLDSDLTSIALLGTAGGKIAYTTAAHTWAEATITAAGRAILDDANAAAQRTTLGLVIGTNVQAWDADLTTLATPTAWRIFYSNAGQTITELALGAAGTFLKSNGAAAAPTWAAGGGGDVTAAANLGDNLLIRGDGAVKGVQNTGITISDSDNVSGMGTLGCGAITENSSVVSLFERTSSVTNAPRAGLELRHTTNQNMVDGFAVGLSFSIKDNAGATNYLAGVYGERDTADNEGKLSFKAGTSGNEVFMTISHLGYVTLNSILAGVADYDKFLVSDGGQIKYRTGTEVRSDISAQPLDSDLTKIATLSSADNNFIVGSAGGWVTESGAIARSSIGLGTSNSPQFTGLTLTSIPAGAADYDKFLVSHSGQVKFRTGAQVLSDIGAVSLWTDPGTYYYPNNYATYKIYDTGHSTGRVDIADPWNSWTSGLADNYDGFRVDVGGYGISNEFHGGAHILSSLVGAVKVPNNCVHTLFCAGVSGYAQTADIGCAGVGGYFQGQCIAAGSNTNNRVTAWGSNHLVEDGGHNWCAVWGTETDVNITNANTWAIGHSIIGGSTVQPGAARALEIAPMGMFVSPKIKWKEGIYIKDGASDIGIHMGTVSEGNNVSSNVIEFLSRSAAAAERISDIYTDSSGNLVIRNQTDSESMGAFLPNAGVYLYYNNAKKFETTNIGVTVTGTVTASCGVLTCDYVFDKNYDLMPLDDLNRYVESEKRLPNMTINKGGVFDSATLRQETVEKIEEQALYIFQLHKRIKILELALKTLAYV